MQARFVLPLPPSVNAMYRSAGRFKFYKSREAKVWESECIKKMKVKRRLKGKLDVEIHFYFNRDSDIDNRIKALLDLMQHAEVMENDRDVYSLLVNKDFDKKNPRVEICIMEN